MMEYRDDDVKINGKGFTRWSQNKGWESGTRITPYGVVDIYCQGDDGWDHFTRLDFVHKGRLYIRNIDKSFGRKKLAQLANEFAKEISSRRPRNA